MVGNVYDCLETRHAVRYLGCLFTNKVFLCLILFDWPGVRLPHSQTVSVRLAYIKKGSVHTGDNDDYYSSKNL